MQSSIKSMAYELDILLGALSVRLATLEDLRTVFGHLREDMDTAAYKGQEKLYYAEHHRKVRLLSELMGYAMDDLNGILKQAEQFQCGFFSAVGINQPEQG